MYLLSMFVKKDGLVRSKTKVFEEDDFLPDEFDDLLDESESTEFAAATANSKATYSAHPANTNPTNNKPNSLNINTCLSQ